MSLLASLYVLVEYVQKEFICRLGSSQVEIVVKRHGFDPWVGKMP